MEGGGLKQRTANHPGDISGLWGGEPGALGRSSKAFQPASCPVCPQGSALPWDLPSPNGIIGEGGTTNQSVLEATVGQAASGCGHYMTPQLAQEDAKGVAKLALEPQGCPHGIKLARFIGVGGIH